ncbi:MAG: cupin domain-containing protein [Spirochaetes bacterium]|nr:cupin domain-containing protein [Spirochaetota bacterium]
MKKVHYTDIKPTHFDKGEIKGVSARVLVGKNDGANNFCMRIFEISPDGHTPRHSHNWEHEIFYHSGEGEVYNEGKWHSIRAGSVVFIPPNEEHQIKNTGREMLTFVCLIPSGVPEL